LNFEYGRTTSRTGVLKNAIKTTLLSLALSVPVLVVGWFVLPGLVARVAPNYNVSPVTIHLALIVAVASTTKLCSNAFSVLGAWKSMYINSGITLLAFWMGPHYGARWMPSAPIEGALWGMIAAQLFQMAAVFGMIALLYRSSKIGDDPSGSVNKG
jgi:hypothetical protein